MMQINVKRLHEYAVVPWYAHSGDSGFDLVAVEDVIVEPGQTVKVPTGLAFEIPSGYEMQIRPRSGITSKTKLRVQLGTVDSGFRGEVSVIVDNIAPVKYRLYAEQPDDEVIYELSEETAWGDCVTITGPLQAHRAVGNWLNTVHGDKTFYAESDPFAKRHLAETYIIRKGTRIAQGVIVPVIHAELVETDGLDDSERGASGFGSSGV